MSIDKFEEGKRYRFLKNNCGDGKLYNGVDAEIGQEFTVHKIDKDGGVYTKDVRFQGLVDTTEGWIVYGNYPELPTTLDDFEEVVEVSGEGVDFERCVCEDDLQYKIEQPIENTDRLYELVPSDVNIEEEEENIFPDLIKEVIALQQEHNLTLMFDCDEVIVHIGDNDTEYQISSQEELTTLIEASKVMKRFERKVNYND
jgi:hypothetical protein